MCNAQKKTLVLDTAIQKLILNFCYLTEFEIQYGA